MEPFRIWKAKAALLDRADVDTDQIIPKQFLKKIERTGFGKHLFHDWRFLDDAGQKPNPDFALNEARYQGAGILVTRDNFGCGSSREHAPWALLDYGFRSILAPSFADIFYNNCFKNGMLLVILPADQIQAVFDQVSARPGAELTVDLESNRVVLPDGSSVPFVVDPFRRECLLNGWDDIGLTLRHESEITRFEERSRADRPFQYASVAERS